MEQRAHSLRSRCLGSLPKPSSGSSSSLADMRVNDPPKLRVLIASNGGKDVAQAQALVVRLSKNPKIETRAIVDEDAYSTHRMSQETLTLKNRPFGFGRRADEAEREIERSQIDWYKQQAYDLCDWADMMVLAPIDADTFAKMLHGITDCFLLEILRGWDVSKKILLVPGMTTAMWENPITKKQLSKVRRKWQWVRVLQPILWHYESERIPAKCFVSWDGFSELVGVIKNQAELMTIGHDVDIATSSTATSESYNTKTDKLLPPELWSTILEYVGDWEIAKALEVYTTLPTPPEWRRPGVPKDEVQVYMRSLERVILTSSVQQIIHKLKAAPKEMKYLSSLCTNLKEVFLISFNQKLLPIKASTVYGRTEILEWWRTSPTFLSKTYTAEAIDGASKSGFIHVLDWWRNSGLDLKYTELALEQASSKGHILVLEWWKQASLHQGNYYIDPDVRHHHGSPMPAERDEHPEMHPPLQLKPGKALLAAAQNDQPLVLRWWDNSGIPIGHSESVAKIASAQGHVKVLDVWRELRGDKMAFDNRILIEPTKNGHVEVLEWWKQFNRAQKDRVGPRAEYKTCDIEEALEDSVGSEGEAFAVKNGGRKMG
ncbi:Phosphopantothenoylcysteine decarboxylase [Lachnellula subtilissima]|uniref:Phosphopantothenoylcysteine decarboxylase n=1 Tax=Lachnellula subtilissima TaxID=602034 RepID=A0A8H8UB40_9HELO|nr:Phosphopantothenoylcysteine decarboxylase [Lachnellula subtilissima]